MPLTQEDAQQLIEAAQGHAATLGIRVTVAVVDEGGHLQALGLLGIAGSFRCKQVVARRQFHLISAQVADPAETLDPAALAAVADRLRDTLSRGEPEQTKALLRVAV